MPIKTNTHILSMFLAAFFSGAMVAPLWLSLLAVVSIDEYIKECLYTKYRAPDKSGSIQTIFFLLLQVNICCGYSFIMPQELTSNEYPQHTFLWRNKKTISTIWLKKKKKKKKQQQKKPQPYLERCNNKQNSSNVVLTLVMLNKLRCHTHFKYSTNQIT